MRSIRVTNSRLIDNEINFDFAVHNNYNCKSYWIGLDVLLFLFVFVGLVDFLYGYASSFSRDDTLYSGTIRFEHDENEDRKTDIISSELCFFFYLHIASEMDFIYKTILHTTQTWHTPIKTNSRMSFLFSTQYQFSFEMCMISGNHQFGNSLETR